MLGLSRKKITSSCSALAPIGLPTSCSTRPVDKMFLPVSWESRPGHVIDRRGANGNQADCKPGSVIRPVKDPKAADGHSSGTRVTARLARSTRAAWSGNGPRGITCRPYSILLLAGFAMPSALPQPRCALAAPFHPCRRPSGRWRSAFCGTFPGVTPAGRYPAPCFRGARTFLPSRKGRAAIRPSDSRREEIACRHHRVNVPRQEAPRLGRWSRHPPHRQPAPVESGAGRR